MTEQRQKLLDEFNSWFNTNPNKRILAAQCANIAEKYAAEQLKLYGAVGQSEQLVCDFCNQNYHESRIYKICDDCKQSMP